MHKALLNGFIGLHIVLQTCTMHHTHAVMVISYFVILLLVSISRLLFDCVYVYSLHDAA